MKLRHLKVTHFRGIKTLDWFLEGDFLCLVGPGDACKSTILDAIELVLSPRWNPIFDDIDFHEADTNQEIVIEATLGELPRKLLSDAKFGLRLRGFCAGEVCIHDEPQDGDEEVITVRLTVGASLEPAWHVVTERHPEGLVIRARERERFGVVRLGAVVDRHLTWSRGSALSRLTGDSEEHAATLAEAARQARNSVDSSQLPKLTKASSNAAALSSKFGVKPNVGYEPRLDPSNAPMGTQSLGLHDGPVPLRRAGLGTRRLVTLAMQRSIEQQGGVVLIDEVENGLEPYRLRRLLSELLDPSTAEQNEGDVAKADKDEAGGVVILTTHSPITLGQLRAKHLRVVRTDAKGTRVMQPPPRSQGHVILHAEAFLSRKVVVCEGRTELGLLLGLDEVWSKTMDPLATMGVALVDGSGATKVASVAMSFRNLEYETAVLADSDADITMPECSLNGDETRKRLERAGVTVVQWDGKLATEQRLFRDLPWTSVVPLIERAMDEGIPVRDQTATALKCSTKTLGDPASWPEFCEESKLREALGERAKKLGWFKNVRLGRFLGTVVAANWNEIEGSDLAAKLGEIKTWAFR